MLRAVGNLLSDTRSGLKPENNLKIELPYLQHASPVREHCRRLWPTADTGIVSGLYCFQPEP